MDKHDLGWHPHWDHLPDTCEEERIVRITQRNRDQYRALTISGDELDCRLSGNLAEHARVTGAKLEREINYTRRKMDQRLAAEQKRIWKERTRRGRERMKYKQGGFER